MAGLMDAVVVSDIVSAVDGWVDDVAVDVSDVVTAVDGWVDDVAVSLALPPALGPHVSFWCRTFYLIRMKLFAEIEMLSPNFSNPQW